MVKYACYESKGDDVLTRVPEASANRVPVLPGPGEESWQLLVLPDEFLTQGEPPDSIKKEEAEKRGLIF